MKTNVESVTKIIQVVLAIFAILIVFLIAALPIMGMTAVVIWTARFLGVSL